MTRFRDVNFFRLTVFVGLSLSASTIVFLADGFLTNSEFLITAVQAILAAFSFLQCPEHGTIHDTKTNGRRKNDVEKDC